jgi:hypothetical protein
MVKRISVAILIISSTASFLLLGFSNLASAQNMTNQMTMSNTSVPSHENHVLDKLIVTENIPLRGQLTDGDYILLTDLTPFATSVEGHNHIALKIPCTKEALPEVTIFAGVAPELKSLDLGKAINNGTLNGKSLDLSDEGKSCLYHTDLPNGITDIGLINTSNRTLDFDTGGYSVTVSIHGTAVQHLAANETAK